MLPFSKCQPSSTTFCPCSFFPLLLAPFLGFCLFLCALESPSFFLPTELQDQVSRWIVVRQRRDGPEDRTGPDRTRLDEARRGPGRGAQVLPLPGGPRGGPWPRSLQPPRSCPRSAKAEPGGGGQEAPRMHGWLLLLLWALLPGAATGGSGRSYPHRALLDAEGKYWLGWGQRGSRLAVRLEVRTAGYVGFGFSPTGTMAAADIVVAGVAHGRPYLQVSGPGQSSPGRGRPANPDKGARAGRLRATSCHSLGEVGHPAPAACAPSPSQGAGRLLHPGVQGARTGVPASTAPRGARAPVSPRSFPSQSAFLSSAPRLIDPSSLHPWWERRGPDFGELIGQRGWGTESFCTWRSGSLGLGISHNVPSPWLFWSPQAPG